MKLQMELPHFRELPADVRGEQRARLVATVTVSRRRRAIVTVAVIVAVLVAAPALALQRELVDFWSAEPAPTRIQLDFDFLREHSAEASALFGSPRITPEGPARGVMRVTLDGETRRLWVVPTAEGSFCYRLHFHGSCVTGDAARLRTIGVGGLATHSSHGLAWIVGSVRDRDVHELVLLYQDGERVTLPYVWVSSPIDAGFYAYDVPENRELPGRLTALILGLDEDGNEVARACMPLPPEDVARSVAEVSASCNPRR